MVEYSAQALDATFQALSDSTRRAILARLREGDASISELARPFKMSFAAVSKHIRVLEGAGLVTRRVEGRAHRCRLNAEPLRAVADWSARYRAFWERRLEALDDLLTSKASQARRRP